MLEFSTKWLKFVQNFVKFLKISKILNVYKSLSTNKKQE